ncbi:MAG: discoidin domain-containing protein [Spirochaetia bacterium]|nr:discoidin domain-containing protein [Spirochaetia bacterium]
MASGKDGVRFSQSLVEGDFGYRYDKTISLNGSDLVVDFSLSNSGAKIIATPFYAHNFMVPEGEGVGTNDSLILNFNLLFANRWRDRIEIRGNEIHPKLNFENELVPLFLDGLAYPIDQSRAVVYNGKLRTGVEIHPEFPVTRYALYVAKRGFCPEPFLSIQLSPGASTNWRMRYRFFQGPPREIRRDEINGNSLSGFNNIRLDGQELDTFNYNKTNYSVAVLDGKIPRVEALTLDPRDRLEVRQTDSFSKAAEIRLKSPNRFLRNYALRFIRINGVSVSANETNDNLPVYSLDEDADTSWVGDKDGGFIRYDFSPPKTISGIGIVFRAGDKRKAFYEVESSTDGKIWEKDFAGSSSGTNASVEVVPVKNPRALKSIRIIGHGNSQNKYNNFVQTYFYETERR